MRRISARSPLLYPGLLFASLMLFCIPDADVQNLRGRTLSSARPILWLTGAGRIRQEPRPASVNVVVENPDAPPQASPSSQAEEIDRLRSDVIGLLNQLRHDALVQPIKNLPFKQYSGISADVIARKILWQEPLLGLNKGDTDGIQVNAGVLHRGAVVGRIVAVGSRASSMALLTHRGLSTGARLVDCRMEGVIQGSKDEGNERLCRMSVVSRDLAAKVGEQVVTSGLDGTFPAGIWIGVVESIKKTGDVQWELSIRPACNENAIESVQILSNTQPAVPWPAMPATKRGGAK